MEPWLTNPVCGIITRAAFIKLRPLRMVFTGTWSSYQQVTFYVAVAEIALCSRNGESCWALDINVQSYVKHGAAFLDSEVDDGGAWSGTYPEFVLSKRTYAVLAIARRYIWSVESDFRIVYGPPEGESLITQTRFQNSTPTSCRKIATGSGRQRDEAGCSSSNPLERYSSGRSYPM